MINIILGGIEFIIWKTLKKLWTLQEKEVLRTISVACCQDEEVLMAVEMARKERIANAILVGDIEKTKRNSEEYRYRFR